MFSSKNNQHSITFVKLIILIYERFSLLKYADVGVLFWINNFQPKNRPFIILHYQFFYYSAFYFVIYSCFEYLFGCLKSFSSTKNYENLLMKYRIFRAKCVCSGWMLYRYRLVDYCFLKIFNVKWVCVFIALKYVVEIMEIMWNKFKVKLLTILE